MIVCTVLVIVRNVLSIVFVHRFTVLLLPAPQAGSATIPLLRLPPNLKPTPDSLAIVKKYTGRTLDRLIGYTWWLLTVVGAGSAILGAGNFFVGLGIWGWFRSKARPVSA